MSLAIVNTRAKIGIEAPPVTVEVHLSNGLPGLSIVGLPETAVKESKDRVRSALINSQFEFPARRITINLAPADIPKDGSRFDLPIAIGILTASNQLPAKSIHGREFIGELALSGELRSIIGILPAAIACGRQQRQLFVPTANAEEAALSQTTEVYGADNLLAVCAHLQNQTQLATTIFSPPQVSVDVLDLEDVVGQILAKRALEVAAAGAHNVLFYGPPGTGKTMLATRLVGILPPLTNTQALAVATIYSLSGQAKQPWQLPPYRTPHHTASAVALVGGGSKPKPGEISLAHHGVLFLDELPEFQRNVLEVLREPLESGQISISRASAQVKFPAQFQLIAAMNPCPCGYLTSRNPRHVCHCTADQVRRYRQKISGPLLDRIDLHVPVNNLSGADLQQLPKGETTAIVRQRVLQARERQQQRQQKTNAQLTHKDIEHYCVIGKKEKTLLNNAMEKLGLSARAYHRILKTARTLADLADETHIGSTHISEAIAMRNFDRKIASKGTG